MASAPVVDPRTRLRTLIAAVDDALVGTPAPAVAAAFAALVDAMALGPEPATRACPKCQAPCRADAQRCGFCWELLPARAGATATASAVSA
ncbi:MAG: hypothetical protein JNK64_22260 [Myxococcales bacterium]|nr:hypothetical protein [Myxococcales bacterium]